MLDYIIVQEVLKTSESHTMRRSRCVQKHWIHYEWRGTPKLTTTEPPKMRQELAEKLAFQFADQELSLGHLDSRRFNKYRYRTVAKLQEILWRIEKGLLTPGSEVIPLARGMQEHLNMFEFRWEHTERQLRQGHRKEHIRHYDLEPPAETNLVIGLFIHLKDVSGDDNAIKDRQNRQIDEAVSRAVEISHQPSPTD